MLTHTALEVDAEGAVQWAAEHPGFYVFPGRMVLEVDADTGLERFRKQPLGRWTEDATNDPDEIRALWHKHGDLGVLCVACAPSGIWVLDQDHDLPDDATGEEWKTILEAVQISRTTLVLQSCTKARPHYVFRQGTEFVAEGTWLAGEVKATGIIFISEAAPIVDAPIAVAPKALLDRLKKGRARGSHGRSACSAEEMWNWILNTPALEDLILDETSGGRFLDAIIDKLAEKIDAGAHRRMATLDAVFQAGIEAEAGCYPAETAYLAIKSAYREHRESRKDGKGWSPQREADYDLMWKAMIPDLRAGEYEDKITTTRTDAVDRYGIWDEPDEDINEVITAILDRPAPSPSPTVGEAVSTTPEPAPAADRYSSPVSTTPAPGPAPGAEPAPAPGAEDDDDWGIPATPAAPDPPAPARAEPKLAEAALWGPHGDLIEALDGRTESSAVGVLGALLAFSGAAMAGSAHWLVGADIHGPNDFILNIGVSSAARKSSGLGLVDKIFFDHDRMAAPGGPAVSYLPRKIRGVGSGEALIRMWTPTFEDDGAGGKTEIWPERRTLMVEGEASSLWKKAHREASTLSDVFCQIWDQTDLATHAVTSGSLSLAYERYLMGFLGCSTLHVAVSSAKAGDGADSKSGFANRFLWLYLPDSGIDLPFGADLPETAVRRYQDQLGLFDGSLGRFGEEGFGERAQFDQAARDKWAEVYGKIKREKGAAGFIEGMLSRGESHVLRLALNYWLAAGGDPKEVSLPALEAALAVWQYAKDSVEYIFGGSTGSRDADNLVAEMETRGGWATMNELRADLNKNTLAGLVKAGVQAGVMKEGTISTGKPGRPPRAVALTAWLTEGRLVNVSGGIGRERGVPLEAVTWE